MPDGYRIHPETGIVVFSNEGVLSFDAWQDAVLAAVATRPTQTSRRFLSDRRRVTAAHTLAMMENIIAFLRGHAGELGDMQWAVLAPDRDDVLAMFQLGEQLTESTRVRVKAFVELREALRWLLGAYEEADITRLTEWIERGS